MSPETLPQDSTSKVQDQGTQGRYAAVPRVLIFLTRGDRILLLRGGPTKWFAGQFNGIGGHIDPGEDVLSAARRETEEETGLRVDDFDLGAIIHVHAGPPPGVMLFVFQAEAPSDEVVGNDEGELVWVARADLSTLPLIEDLHWLIPRLQQRAPHSAPLYAAYFFKPDGLRIVEASGGA